MTTKLKRLIIILPVIVVLVVLGVTYFALQIGASKPANEQISAAAPVPAAPVQENGTAMAPAADTSVSPEQAAVAPAPATARAPIANRAAAPNPAAARAAEDAKAQAAIAALRAKDEKKYPCDYDAWVGKPFTESDVQKTGRAYMLLQPNDREPMEYQADRIKVRVDKDRIVTKVSCG
jgi:hypothetical protein